jgi:hypothetical protein
MQDNPLQGVTDLVGGSMPAAPATQDASQSGTFLPTPSDASQVPSSPALPDTTPATSTFDTAPSTPTAVTVTDDSDSSSSSGASDSKLLDLKQQALQQLTPLVSHLDQTPLEKFRTTMMLIQASDNQALLKEAYDAAQKIEDDKVRAQALLDVINEINYFTQPKEQ